MIEIPWQKYGPNEERYTFHDYMFRKRQLSGHERYEVWKNGELCENNLTYFDFLKVVQDIYRQYWHYRNP